jgi:iron complex outermembrane receptor protein
MTTTRTILALAILAAFPLARAQMVPAPQSEEAVREDAPARQTLPMTKEVSSGEALSQSQEGYSEAVKNVAGLSPTNSSGTSNDSYLIRGIKLNLFSNYRLDGGLPVTGVITNPTENKDRVETLKGANALMFGIASPAGIINFIPKRAGAKDITSFGVAGNGFGQYGFSTDIGRRFGAHQQLGVRIGASAVHLENGVRDLGGEGNFASVGVDLRVSPRLTLQGDFEHYERHVPEQAGISLLPAANGVVPITPVPNPRNLLSGAWDMYTPRTTNLQLRADYALTSDWKVLVQGGQSESHRHRETVRIGNYNIGTGANGIVTVQPITHDYRNTFYRAELLGHFNTWGIGHDLTLGVSSSERWAHAYDVQNVTLPQRQNIFNPIALNAPVYTRPGANNPVQDSTDSGVYFYDTISVTKQLKLLAGMRFVKDEEVNGSVSSTSRVRSPAAGVLYDIRPTTTLYASYMQGLEAGATSPFNAANPNVILGPTVSRQKEIGIRDTSFKGLSLNAAYFDVTRANAATDPVTNIFGYYGDIQYRGIEATAAWDINRHWRLTGAVLRLDAKQKSPVQPAFNGKVPENTPNWNANLNVQYRPDFAPGLTLRAGLKTISRRAVNNADQGWIPGYTLWELGANYATKVAGHRTTFGVAIDNVGNKRYWNSVQTGTYGIGMDRTIKVNAKIDF